MTAYADTCNRIYSPRGVVAHLSYPGWPGGQSLCPAPEPRGGWLGTGRQDEYEHAASMPLCSRCVRLAAERDPQDCAASLAPVASRAPGDARAGSPGQPAPVTPCAGAGTPQSGLPDASAPVGRAGTSPGPSASRRERRTAGRDTGTWPGRAAVPAADARPGQDEAAARRAEQLAAIARARADRGKALRGSPGRSRRRALKTDLDAQLRPGMIRRPPPEPPRGGAS